MGASSKFTVHELAKELGVTVDAASKLLGFLREVNAVEKIGESRRYRADAWVLEIALSKASKAVRSVANKERKRRNG